MQYRIPLRTELHPGTSAMEQNHAISAIPLTARDVLTTIVEFYTRKWFPYRARICSLRSTIDPFRWSSALFHSCTLVLLVIIANAISSPIPNLQIGPSWYHSQILDKVARMQKATGNTIQRHLLYIREAIASYWRKHVVPYIHSRDLDAIKIQVTANQDAITRQAMDVYTIKQQLAQVQSSVLALEKTSSSLTEQSCGHAETIKTLIKLVGYQAATHTTSVRNIERLRDQDRADWKMKYKILQKLFDEKLLSFQSTIMELSSKVDKIGRDHSFLTAEYQQMVFIQKKIESTQKSLLDNSLPTTDSIERVQIEVDSLRSYLLEEADSRRSLLEGRKGSMDWARG